MILLTHERQWRGGETVVAFGMFDGVHEGHAQLMRKANELAALYDLKSVVYTFSSHPMATETRGHRFQLFFRQNGRGQGGGYAPFWRTIRL